MAGMGLTYLVRQFAPDSDGSHSGNPDRIVLFDHADMAGTRKRPPSQARLEEDLNWRERQLRRAGLLPRRAGAQADAAPSNELREQTSASGLKP